MIAVCTAAVSQAQTFRVIKATRQSYAGGVAGNYGTGYNIEIATRSHTAIPDTVWIDGNFYALNFKTKQGNMLQKTDSVTHEITYTISVGESHSQFNKNLKKSDTAGEKPKSVRQFRGAALISYTMGHTQHFFTVKSFTVLPRVNYP